MYPPSTARFEHELKKAVGRRSRDVMTADPVDGQADTHRRGRRDADGRARRELALPVLDGDELVGIVSQVATSSARSLGGPADVTQHRWAWVEIDLSRHHAQRAHAQGAHAAGHPVHGGRQGRRLRARRGAGRARRARAGAPTGSAWRPSTRAIELREAGIAAPSTFCRSRPVGDPRARSSTTSSRRSPRASSPSRSASRRAARRPRRAIT